MNRSATAGNALRIIDRRLAHRRARGLIQRAGGSLLQQHFGSRPVFWTVMALELLAGAGMFATAVITRRRWTVRS